MVDRLLRLSYNYFNYRFIKAVMGISTFEGQREREPPGGARRTRTQGELTPELQG